MKKLFTIICLCSCILAVNGQETYEIAELSRQDLNGTARYIGMGGAMDALGADISTISSNPAGIGLFRKSQAAVSIGVVSQNGNEFDNISPTRVSFDQAGMVFSVNTGFRKQSYLNFGFNYSKSRNFAQILEASGVFPKVFDEKTGKYLYSSSQNRQTCGKGVSGIFEYGNSVNQVDYLYGQAGFIEEIEKGKDRYYEYYYDNGDEYQMNRAVTGHTNNFDMNISGNINNRVFLGITFGLKDVLYKAHSQYDELLVPKYASSSIYDSREISGSAFDVKFGAIIRPIESSPFRIGLSIATPTWYRLRSSNYTDLIYTYEDVKTGKPARTQVMSEESYRYRFSTPWNFGISLGHTFGTSVALGVCYNYADYSSTTARIDDGYEYGYDYYGPYEYSVSRDDRITNEQLSKTLKGVSTLKVGAEIKPISELAIRFGYNYVNPMYSEDGMKDPSVCSVGNYYMSQTDYTNWKATNRFTAGVGYTIDKFGIDFSYQYSCQKGDFYPFSNGSYYFYDDHDKYQEFDNSVAPCEVKNNRHQVLMTLSYKF